MAKKFFQVVQMNAGSAPQAGSNQFATREEAEKQAKVVCNNSIKQGYRYDTYILEAVGVAECPIPDIKITRLVE